MCVCGGGGGGGHDGYDTHKEVEVVPMAGGGWRGGRGTFSLLYKVWNFRPCSSLKDWMVGG